MSLPPVIISNVTLKHLIIDDIEFPAMGSHFATIIILLFIFFFISITITSIFTTCCFYKYYINERVIQLRNQQNDDYTNDHVIRLPNRQEQNSDYSNF